MTRIVPYHNTLVVEEFELGEISKGGLLIPQIAKASTPYRYARVIETGPGRYTADGKLVPCSSKPGDIVAIVKNQGQEFPLDDESGVEKVYRLINEQFVLGRVEGMPEQSSLTGLDGRLLMMRPGSQARSDGAYQQLDAIARARKDGFIDSKGGTLDDMEAMDTNEAEVD